MKVRKATIFLLSLLLFAAGCRSRTIEGVVTDEKGQPIEKADVVVFDAQDKPVGHRITTAPDGRYSVPVDQGKPYAIGIYKFGFEMSTRRIAADSNGPQNFSLTLRRVHNKGDRVRVLDSGWCPGTIVGMDKENELYDVELDAKPSMKVTVTTKASEIRPLENQAPASPLPCSHFKKQDSS